MPYSSYLSLAFPLFVKGLSFLGDLLETLVQGVDSENWSQKGYMKKEGALLLSFPLLNAGKDRDPQKGEIGKDRVSVAPSVPKTGPLKYVSEGRIKICPLLRCLIY